MTKFIERPVTKRGISRRRLTHGVGVNDAAYVTCPNRERHCPYYVTWTGMLKRCYSKSYQKITPAYIGCTVVEAWHTFSTFRKWMEKQPWKGNQLDKDIITPGNKIYSPETCCFISPELNSLLLNTEKVKGKWPVGVTFVPRRKKYQSQCRVPGARKYLGYFYTPEEAHQAYVNFKEPIIMEKALEQTDPRIKKGLLLHAALLTSSLIQPGETR